MAIMVIYRATGVSREAYAPYEAEVSQQPLPKEALLHLVGLEDDEGVVVDVWEDRTAFEKFTEKTINPLLRKHGIPIVPPAVLQMAHVIAQPELTAPRLLSMVA
jgi:hypothetical protein